MTAIFNIYPSAWCSLIQTPSSSVVAGTLRWAFLKEDGGALENGVTACLSWRAYKRQREPFPASAKSDFAAASSCSLKGAAQRLYMVQATAVSVRLWLKHLLLLYRGGSGQAKKNKGEPAELLVAARQRSAAPSLFRDDV